ncbi:MAG: wax ester/triacylglycerol synthase family O-acyltransferase [Actinobacteria bacterium]|nr:wax ester/triacylglycerol synthase family O-acyltransferase [Actinomycetota bacterium]
MDTMFVRAETRSMLLHVTGVLVLAPGARSTVQVRDQIREVVRCRLPAVPPLRWRLVEPPGGLGALRWVDDPDFDPINHVHLRALPAGASWRDVEAATGEIAARPLDRHKALWEMYVLDGMADGTIPVVAKFHHAFMDGGAGMELMAALFDLDPDVEIEPLDGGREAEPVPSRWQLLVATPGEVVQRLGRVPVALATLTGLGRLAGGLLPIHRGIVRQQAVRTSFNRTLGCSRAVALTTCSLDDAKATARAFNVKVNDVVLAAVASSLRDALDGEHLAGTIIAAVPISIRASHPEARFGNHTSAMLVPLPVNVADPVDRLEVLAEATKAAKAEHATMGNDLIERWAGVVPPWLISTGARLARRVELTSRLPPFYNLIVSNVAGPPVPIYLAGSEVLATYPLGPLLDGIGLNVTVISQRDQINVGILCDPNLLPDPGALGGRFTAAIEALTRASSSPQRTAVGAR